MKLLKSIIKLITSYYYVIYSLKILPSFINNSVIFKIMCFKLYLKMYFKHVQVQEKWLSWYLNLFDQCVVRFNFVFQFQTDDYNYPPESQAHLTLNTVAYKSINQRYLYINLPPYSSVFDVGNYANININFQYRDYLSLKTFSYQVGDCQISRLFNKKVFV